MASKNNLLGSGVPEQDIVPLHRERTQKKTPCWRFHKDYPDKLVKFDDELEALEKQGGWVDEPGKARRLPGHEKIYDEYHNPPAQPVQVVDVPRETTCENNNYVETKRLFYCLVCGKSFKSAHRLSTHAIVKHRDKKELTQDEIKVIQEHPIEMDEAEDEIT